MGTFSIRKGIEADLPQIVQLLINSWQENYASFLPAELLDNMNSSKQIERHKTYMRGKATYFVAEQENKLIGFSSFGLNRDTQISAKWELYTLYVEKRSHGKGIGMALLNRVCQKVPDLGRGIAVWVMEANPFRSFYEKQGFMEESRLSFDFGGFEVAHVAYVKK